MSCFRCGKEFTDAVYMLDEGSVHPECMTKEELVCAVRLASKTIEQLYQSACQIAELDRMKR